MVTLSSQTNGLSKGAVGKPGASLLAGRDAYKFLSGHRLEPVRWDVVLGTLSRVRLPYFWYEKAKQILKQMLRQRKITSTPCRGRGASLCPRKLLLGNTFIAGVHFPLTG